MKRKGWARNSEQHSLASRGLRTKFYKHKTVDSKNLDIQVWYNGEVTATFNIMSELLEKPIFQKEFKSLVERDAITRLLDKDLITRKKIIAPSGHEAYILSLTKKGWKQIQLAKQYWEETVQPLTYRRD